MVDWPRTLATRGAQPLHRSHLRFRAEETGAAALHCFVLDCSASMVTHGQLARAKGLVAAWLQAAYQRRDDVALLCFAGGRLDWRLKPGRARAWTDREVMPIAGGGGTSLMQGLAEADAVLAQAARRQPGQSRCLWLLTDGRSPQQPPRPRAAHHVGVVDFESSRVKLGRNAVLATRWGAVYLQA